ncbi:MAG TPA: bifunctional 3,4-dihydroxy-2-butanone-4-phosphate synthase/GTP cyclohydrolase II [Rhodocyclaceae bacterium]
MSDISPIHEIIAEISAGRMVILVDEEDRENEGDLVLAADQVTPEAINFMAKFGRGLICLTLTQERCKQLDLPLMVQDNRTPHGTAFTMSIEAAEGVTTGISAHDRSRTVQAAVAKNARPSDIVQPGHIFPLMAQNGGVLVRAGHTEAGCDLSRLAGREPAAVICEIMNDDGSMARLPELIEFGKQHGLKIGTIRDLIHYRNATEKLVERVASRTVRGSHGEFQLHAYLEKTSDELHFALVRGEITPGDEVLVRVHQPLSILDFIDFHGLTYSFSIDQAMSILADADKGVLILLQRKDINRAMVAALTSRDETPGARWDNRLFGTGAQILLDLGVTKMRLMGRQQRLPSMAGFGLEVTGYLTPEDIK